MAIKQIRKNVAQQVGPIGRKKSGNASQPGVSFASHDIQGVGTVELIEFGDAIVCELPAKFLDEYSIAVVRHCRKCAGRQIVGCACDDVHVSLSLG